MDGCKMDGSKSGILLENKLLTSSKLQGARLLQSNLVQGGPESLGGPGSRLSGPQNGIRRTGDFAPKAGTGSDDKESFTGMGKSEMPVSMENYLLNASIARDLTTNHLLGSRTSFLSEKRKQAESSSCEEMKAKGVLNVSLQNKRLDVNLQSAVLRPSLKSNLLLTSSKPTKTTGQPIQTTETKATSSLLMPEKLLSKKHVKQSSFNGVKDFKSQRQTKKTHDIEPEITPVVGAIELEEASTFRPVYELSFNDDDFSKELSGRSKELANFSGKLKKNVTAENERIAVIQCKTEFLNIASVSMIQQPDFYSKYDDCRTKLLSSVDRLCDVDPEFVLKVALYSRRELNIRTATNFILALAAFHKTCRPYLKRYFNASVMLPSDWIQVAEFYQSLHDKGIHFGSLPTALRKVMIDKFSAFDEYQLAKYNKEKSRLKKDKAIKGQTGRQEERRPPSKSSESGSDSDEELQKRAFTLKQLIRKLHVSQPVYPVMCLVGKKYPSNVEEFRSSRLEGLWEEEKAGKRMKLATPETWETQVSLKGNKASTWEQLIDHKKLPFMAMLRNLRNMLQAGISTKHHNVILKRLTNEDSVIKSKQFPFRFFSAYDVLNDLDEKYKEWEQKAINGELVDSPPTRGGRGMLRGLPRGRGRGRGGKRRAPKMMTQLSDFNYDSDLIKRYRKALDTALRISCVHNITPMPGSSIIICDVAQSLDAACSSAKSFGKTKTVLEVGLLLGLMAKYSCEECKLLLFLNGNFILFEIHNQETILTNLVKALEKAKNMRIERNGEDTKQYLFNLISDQVKIDNLMFFSNYLEDSSKDIQHFLESVFVEKYRTFVNTDMLFVNINLTGSQGSFASSENPKNISIGTYSDQILRFVAERGNSTLLSHVDNIDLAYNLRDIKVSGKGSIEESANEVILSPSIERSSPWWKNVRVFISSTFRDMHGERDLLTRYVFPELRARAMQHFINIYEIDLRWGITEEQSRSESQVEICLSEVLRSDIFIGILGGRYGWIPGHVDLDRLPGCERLEGRCEGKSITELEMNLFALTRVDDVAGHAFFYIRDQSFVRNIPEEYLSDFCSEDQESISKLLLLEEAVRRSGLEQYRYACAWGGVVDGKPIASNLEDFGNRVLNNVWNAVKNNYLNEMNDSDVSSENTHEAFAEKAAENFVGRKSTTRQFLDAISTCSKSNIGVLVAAGKSGCGKTSFMAKLYKDLAGERPSCLCYFADAVPDKRSIHDMVKHLFISLLLHVKKPRAVPDSFRELQSEFSQVLEDTGKQSEDKELVIFIDGIDLVETTAKTSLLGWLPDPVPKGILFVISCHQDGLCAKTLESRRTGVEMIRIGPLDMMERMEFVRRLLKKHRKELDESAFNNQMKLLVSKREANLPIFLKFACEELRFFGVYEKVSDHLRKLAQTVPMLLQSIASRLENDHGKDLVSWSLLVLYISRQALSEDELFEMICFVDYCRNFTTQQLNSNILLNFNQSETQEISRIEFAMLARSLKGFIQQSEEQSLQLSFSDVRSLVKQRYIRAASSENVTRIHRVLAAYYKRRSFDSNWRQGDSKALSEIIHHMAAGGLWQDLEDALCSLSFIYAKFQAGLGSQLLEDFQANVDDLSAQQERQRIAFIENPRVKEYQDLVRRNMHILNQYPVLVIQQALNDPASLQINADAEQCSKKQNVLQWLNKPSKSSPLKRTINFNEAVLSMDISADGRTVVCGAQDGTVRMFDIDTGNDTGSFIGHADGITSCCFAGPQKLISASMDCTLSIWDVSGGHRVRHLKGHRRPVTCCVPVPLSQQVVSVSLDCQAILWNIQNGSIAMTFKSGNRPYNGVACDPTGRLVALAGWDCVVKVWDLLTNKRQGVLKGHESAVRAVTFSPSGNHLVSSALLGEVFLWAVQSSTRVGKFSFGSIALNSIKYTANSLQMIGACADSSVKVLSGTLGQPCGIYSDDDDDKNDWALTVVVDAKGDYFYVGYNSGRVVSFYYTVGAVVQRYGLHKSAVRSICISKDNKCIVTASDDRTAKIVNIKDSSVVTLEGHSAGLRCVQMTSSQIATGSEDYTVMLWDILFMEEDSSPKPSAVLRHHTGYVTCCDFSPCETKLLSGSTDKSIIIWDVVSKTPIHVLNDCHRDWVNACAWSDVGDYVVTGSNDFTLKLWDAKTGTQKYEFLGNTSAINGVVYKFGCVASTAFDGSLRVWTHKGAEITTIQAHKDRANGLFLWIPDKMDVADWDVEDTSDMSTNQLIKSKQPKLDQVDIITVSDDGKARKWKPFMPHFIENLNGHTDVVSNVVVSPNGRDVFSCSYDKTIKCWDQSLFEERDRAHSTEVKCVRISDNGKHALSCGRDGHVGVWSLSPCKLVTTFQASLKSVNSLCFLDSDQFVTGDDLGVLSFWNLRGHMIDSMKVPGYSSFPVTSIARNGQYLGVATCSKCVIYFIDKDKPSKWANGGLDVNEKSWIMNIEIGKDGKTNLAALTDDVICSLKIARKEKKGSAWKPLITVSLELSFNVELSHCIVPEDEHHNREAFEKGTIFGVKQIATGQNKLAVFATSKGFVGTLSSPNPDKPLFKAHDNAITDIAIVNRMLITGSTDTTVKVWDLDPLYNNIGAAEDYQKIVETVRAGKIRQIGLFFCQGPVTSLDAKEVDEECVIFAGDRTGNVEILRFFK